ncbi:cytochrome c biogenesis protein CcdA [Aminobacterium sp. UBA5514]|uniref:cytochrome c biogenesis protein CcdA n=1 Tax=Aminobacterium sp. UBA5514 TaxID=1946036 RepID=UPI00257944F6|nr:cytochrome c biogenesis protein CcdA [Aminobacterium sp. UBA5514]
MTQILEGLSKIISESSWLAPILALFAGVLTSFTPCSLSGIPLVIGYVGGTGQRSTKKAFWLSVTFTLGVAVTFTTLGASASIAGRLIGTSASWWYIILGILMLLMALQTWGIYEIIPSSYLLSKNTRRGYLGAFIAGVLGGVFASPCSTPVLIALLAIVAGTSIGFVQKLSSSEKYGKASTILKIVMGALILLIGFYMFYLGF